MPKSPPPPELFLAGAALLPLPPLDPLALAFCLATVWARFPSYSSMAAFSSRFDFFIWSAMNWYSLSWMLRVGSSRKASSFEAALFVLVVLALVDFALVDFALVDFVLALALVCFALVVFAAAVFEAVVPARLAALAVRAALELA